MELAPDVVTILAAWKLDAVHCAGFKVGAPHVSLAALCALHERLIACESRLICVDGSTVTQEAHDGIAGTAHAQNATPIHHYGTPTGARQLDLAFDDVRVRGMTLAERHAVVMA